MLALVCYSTALAMQTFRLRNMVKMQTIATFASKLRSVVEKVRLQSVHLA